MQVFRSGSSIRKITASNPLTQYRRQYNLEKSPQKLRAIMTNYGLSLKTQKRITHENLRFCRSFSTSKDFPFKAVPYRFDRQEAARKFVATSQTENESSEQTQPRSLITSPECRLRKEFKPFISADIDLSDIRFYGSFGHHYYIPVTVTVSDGKGSVRTMTQMQRQTQWFPVEGLLPPIELHSEEADMQVYASFGNHHIEKALAGNHSLRARTNFSVDLLTEEADIEPYEMRMVRAKQILLNRATQIVQQEAINVVTNRYNPDEIKISVAFNNRMRTSSFLLPAYILSNFGNTSLDQIMCGYSGKISKSPQPSVPLYALGGAISGVTTMLGQAWLVGRMASPQTFVLSAALQSFMAAAYAYGKPLAEAWFDRRHASIARDENAKIAPTLSDRKRYNASQFTKENENKTFSKNSEKFSRHNHHQEVRSASSLPSRHLEVLGLNNKHLITKNDIKIAFRQKIRQWHPDTYQGDADTKTATEKTIKIVQAYHALNRAFDESQAN